MTKTRSTYISNKQNLKSTIIAYQTITILAFITVSVVLSPQVVVKGRAAVVSGCRNAALERNAR